MNDQMREYADEIKSLEAQVSAQTRTLDNYRASGEDAQANAELAQKTAEGYEKLLSVEGSSFQMIMMTPHWQMLFLGLAETR